MESEYAPLLVSGKTARRRRLLRTAEVNLVGILVLLSSCVVGAALGFGVGRILGLPLLVAIAGGVIPLTVVAALDRRRWSSMLVGYGWGGTTEEVSDVVADLGRRGVVANVEPNSDGGHASLRYRNADRAVVSTVLAERRIPPVPFPT